MRRMVFLCACLIRKKMNDQEFPNVVGFRVLVPKINLWDFIFIFVDVVVCIHALESVPSLWFSVFVSQVSSILLAHTGPVYVCEPTRCFKHSHYSQPIFHPRNHECRRETCRARYHTAALRPPAGRICAVCAGMLNALFCVPGKVVKITKMGITLPPFADR